MSNSKKVNMEIDYEGSWALLMEELTYKGHQRNQWRMLDIEVYNCATYGKERYYSFYMSEDDIIRNQDKFYDFLMSNNKVNECLLSMEKIILKLETQDWYGKSLADKFLQYCECVEEYLGYYNEVFSDLWYGRFNEVIYKSIPERWRFAENFLVEALLATDNRNLMSFESRKDIIELSRCEDSKRFEEAIISYVEKYKAIKKSSTFEKTNLYEVVESEINNLCDVDIQIFKNAEKRNQYAVSWSEREAELLQINHEDKVAIDSVRKLSYMKLKMREEFQKFKENVKSSFLDELIQRIGKQEYDYMFSDEIFAFIQNGKRVSSEVLKRRREGLCFEYINGKLSIIEEFSTDINSKKPNANKIVRGNVLLGSGVGNFEIIKYVQDDGCASELDKLEKMQDKSQLAVITNTLRPYMIPKLKGIGVIITKQGGFTSHASVLCRELGIKSIIGATTIMQSFETGDLIKIDFDKGIIREIKDKSSDKDNNITMQREKMIDIPYCAKVSLYEVGNKAANLNELACIASIPRGFVISRDSYEDLYNEEFKRNLMKKIEGFQCKYLAIRSSHESEDGTNNSFAGLFKSFVNIDATNEKDIICCIKNVFDSFDSESVHLYNGGIDNGMHVLVQEMINADITGVVLSSKVHKGYEYMLIEYTYGDLADVMDGTVTPFSTYVSKAEIYDKNYENCFYPPILDKAYENSFRELVSIAMKIEEAFGGSVEIEWGIRDSKVIIFQARLCK